MKYSLDRPVSSRILASPCWLLIARVLTCIVVTACTVSADLNSGLVLYFNFDEDQDGTVMDHSSNYNNQGYVNGPVHSTDGIAGGAYIFDGIDDEIIVSNAACLNPASEITISAWMKCAGTGTYNGIVMMKGSPPRGNTAQYALIYFPNSNQGVQGKASFSTGVGWWRDYCSAWNLDLNTWYHLVGTYKSGALNLYVNGTLAYSSTTIKGLLPVMAGNLYIGSEHSFPNDEFFKGMIDEVRIYDRELTASEVLDLFVLNASNAAPSAVLTATPLSGQPPLHVAFDFSGSSDPNLNIELFQLDVDGDGSYDYQTNTATVVYHDYAVVGCYTARVRVVDSCGVSAVAEAVIRVANTADNLVLHFSFDDDEGGVATDLSSYGNSGVVHGAQFVPAGRCGGAYWFDGVDDEIEVTNHPSLNPTNEITVCAWMRCFNSGTHNGIVMLKGTPPRGGTAQYALIYFPDNLQGVQGKASFSLGVAGWHDYYSDGTLDLNTWHHLAGTYKSGQLRLYVDGKKAYESTLAGAIPVQSGNLFIGSEHPFPRDEFFQGLIDEVRIYNRALAEVEINAIYEFCPDTAPIAMLTATPAAGVAPLGVQLDFSGSSDPDGNLVLCEIDKDGDGLYEFSCPEPGLIVVEYAAPGIYHPQLRVCDAFAQKTVTSATVTVYADTAPHAVLTATPQVGPAPLTVTLSGTQSWAVADRTLTIYEFDPDGDGYYDLISTSGMVVCTYDSPSVYTAALRVTDHEGLQDVDQASIKVQAGVQPPQVSLSADPSNGTVPLDVAFTASCTDNTFIVRYQWDFDGDGVMDAVTETNRTTFTYAHVGSYVANVTVTDSGGLSASAQTKILVVEDNRIRVWISKPKAGSSLWGDAISIIGHVAPADKQVGVQFQYSGQGEGAWHGIGTVVYPAPSVYKMDWDVTGLTDGTNYQLRAVALMSEVSVATSEVVVVFVSSSSDVSAGGVVETVRDGVREKVLALDKDQTTELEISDGTAVTLPAGATEADATVRVELVGVNTNPVNGVALGQQNINSNCIVSLDDNPMLLKPITLTMPYSDVNNDGIVDGTGIPESTLTIQYFDPGTTQWKRVLDSMVDPEANVVKGVLYHLTEFGLFGGANLLSPEMGGMLISFTSQSTNDNTGAIKLTDGNNLSYWKSLDEPASVQEFTYAFSDYKGAVINRALLYNYGEEEHGQDYYSRDFRIQISMDNSVFTTICTGTLPAKAEATLFELPVTTGRYVRLQITCGFSTQALEMAEFAVYGTLTKDADADLMDDGWEMRNLGNFSRNGDEDFDNDGLKDRQEFMLNGNPNLSDTDGDGASDYDEYVAGTLLNDQLSLFRVFFTQGSDDPDGNRIILRWSSVVGKSYRIYGSANLNHPWPDAPIGDPVAGDGAEKSYSNAVPSVSAGFYRVGVR